MSERTWATVRDELARNKHALRVAQDAYPFAKAQAEARVIARHPDGLKGFGANEADRVRNLLLAIEQEPAYVFARDALRAAQGAVEVIEAELEAMRDQRREREYEQRERLIDALDGRSVLADLALGEG